MTRPMRGFDPDREADTWEPEVDVARDVVRALVDIRGDCGIHHDEMARRLGVPSDLLARLEDGTYPPDDDLIDRYAAALGKITVPLPYQLARGDSTTGWSCDEIEYDDYGEPRFRSIPALRGSIGGIIDRHFPALTRHGRIYFPSRSNTTTVADLVFFHDQVIRDVLARHTSTALEKGERGHRRWRVTYAAPSDVKPVLKRMLAAIDARSPLRYRKASHQLTAEGDELLSKALDQMGEIGFLYGERITDEIGPRHAPPYRDDPYWSKRRHQIQGAIALIEAGRPSAEWRDDSVREIVILWSCLSGDPIRSPDPGSRDPELCELGEMSSFVTDVAGLYSRWGLADAVPGDSGSRWTRILKPLLKKRGGFLG